MSGKVNPGERIRAILDFRPTTKPRAARFNARKRSPHEGGTAHETRGPRQSVGSCPFISQTKRANLGKFIAETRPKWASGDYDAPHEGGTPDAGKEGIAVATMERKCIESEMRRGALQFG